VPALTPTDSRESQALLDEVRDRLGTDPEQRRRPDRLNVAHSHPAELLTRHGLGGLRSGDAVADEVASRYRALVRHASRISGSLHDAGIRHAVLRGPVSAAEYPRPAGRYFADLDLLVDRSQLTGLPALFQRIGLRQGTVVGGMFHPVQPAELGRERQERRLHAFVGVQPLPDGRPLVVEVHHQFLPPYAVGTRDVTSVLDRVEPLTDSQTGVELPALHPIP
jgi:hypothetical protein